MGTCERIAISCARRIFLIVSGHHDPAFTVASLATTTTSRSCTRPTTVTTPAPGAAPISSPLTLSPAPFPRCFILIVSHQQSNLLRIRILIEQEVNALARGEFTLAVLPFNLFRSTTKTQSGLELTKLVC